MVPAVLPFFHSFGLSVVMLRSLQAGAKLVTLPKFDPIAFLRIIADNRVSRTVSEYSSDKTQQITLFLSLRRISFSTPYLPSSTC